jgi:hypothetical protein
MSEFRIGRIDGTGHHLGDHGVVRNGPADPAVTALAVLTAELARQVDAHRGHLHDASTVDEAVDSVRAELERATPDPTRMEALLARVRDGAAGIAVILGLADQIGRMLGGA